jgi:hypothetical protein
MHGVVYSGNSNRFRDKFRHVKMHMTQIHTFLCITLNYLKNYKELPKQVIYSSSHSQVIGHSVFCVMTSQAVLKMAAQRRNSVPNFLVHPISHYITAQFF